MSKLTRRKLLIFFGSSAAAATVLAPNLGNNAGNNSPAWGQSSSGFTPVRLPHPLPIYQTQNSFVPTGIGQGTTAAASSNPNLDAYAVVDDVVVPPEYERYVPLQNKLYILKERSRE